ncbi:MAG TPA: LutB/LldF family L-lactate oxidation iron-sulfur protein [Thermodesulfobacteriota bacterium]|nr:LutB/LldF family L-lactate oxidation iron-sulfur protein [Thermodesulfobacteriota bacterium]
METKKLNFKKDSLSALKNQSLRKALVKTTDRFRSVRKEAVREFGNWDDLRNRARKVKEEAIGNLNNYLEMLERNVIKAGGNVHWAKDDKEACEIILNIARKRNVNSVVKSKSMATEEIELNHAFEGEGIKVVETDLGEYIIQLAKERPSHIIAPAIHKSKEDISKLFSEKLGIPLYDEPELLTKVARERLRQEFLSADMGVSGVNFAVAETGTIVIVENEGNARLTTTVPKVHVALMGMEKIIPRFQDLPVFLSVLMRSATGQKITTYVSFITGPKKKDDLDGPEEFHLVVLDNGRSNILASPETRESLYCIRCGACLNVCPVYRQVGGHSYGGIYSGPIGAILTPQLLGIDKAPDLPFASSLCGACHDVCPVKIDFPKVLLELRSRVIENEKSGEKGSAFLERFAIRLWRLSMQNKTVYNLLARLSRLAQKPLLQDNGKIGSLPFPFSGWTDQRDFPAVARTPFRKRWKEIKGS